MRDDLGISGCFVVELDSADRESVGFLMAKVFDRIEGNDKKSQFKKGFNHG